MNKLTLCGLGLAMSVLAGCGQAPAPVAIAPAATLEASSFLDKVSAEASITSLGGPTNVYAAAWLLVTGPTGKPSPNFNKTGNDLVHVAVGKAEWESDVFLGKGQALYVKAQDGKNVLKVGTFSGPAVPARGQAIKLNWASSAGFKVKSEIRTGNDFPPLPERYVSLHLTLKAAPKAEKPADVLLRSKAD